MKIDTNDITQILQQTGKEKHAVIPILQAIQNKYNYLPEDALKYVSNNSDITAAEILGVASFYSQFRLQPVGDNIVKVCVGTACHVKGAGLVYDAFKRDLNLTDNTNTDASGKYTLEKVSCLGCCTLAPVVQINDITYGHVSTDQTKIILEDFENQKDNKNTKKFRTGSGDEIKGEIRIGLGSCCVASGSGDIKNAIEQTIHAKNLNVNVKHVGCVGMCHQVPLVEVVPKDGESRLFAKVKPEDIKPIVDKHFKPKGIVANLKNAFLNAIETIQSDEHWDGIERYTIDVREKQVASFLDNQVPMATELRGILNPGDIEEYKDLGGFQGLKKALHTSSKEIIEAVKISGIRGRGGAGFPTYIKWETISKQKDTEKYLICNGDEGDPGAFMDRMLLESYPYRVIEGILIAAKAINIAKGYFYIRAEYPLAVRRVQEAIDKSYEHNYLGKNILGSGFNFDIEIIQGAGAFVCGEETALIASIEGRRGFPRLRPPFPAEKGLYGKPTLVNNTETFAHIPYIFKNGAENFAKIGTEDSKGTKVFALAGKIAKGGLIEVPMGMTIRQIVEEIGGGVANNKKLKAVQIGGPSGGCIPHWLADTPVDFNSLTSAGAMMGSGGLVVLDETDCMIDIARYFLSFTQEESCGKCTFCRVGTKRMLNILDKFATGKAKKEDISVLEDLAKWVKKGSLCGLGKTAPNPVLSTLNYFRDEYEAHINGVCPTGKCTELITYSITDDCIGCTKCSQACPADAIPFNPHKKHVIDVEKCIKCDSCRQVCPENAINVK